MIRQHQGFAALVAAGLYLPCAVSASDTVLVTAARIPVPASSAGSSVSVIDREYIEQRNVIFGADLLTDTPGISVGRSGGPGAQAQVRMRGAEANQVLVLVDGVEANNPSGNGEFPFEHLTSDDIQRIEIVRGPQSALWGSDALAGVINIITRTPEAEPEFRAFAEAGADNSFFGGGRLAGGSESIRGGLSVSRFSTSGTNVARTGQEDDGYRNTTGQLVARADAGDALQLSLNARYSSATTETDTEDFTSDPSAATYGLPVDTANELDLGIGQLGGGAVYHQPDSAWTHILRGSWFSTRLENRDPAGFDTAQDADKYGAYAQTSVNVAGDPAAGVGHALTLALDHEREDFAQRGSSPFGDPRQDQRLHNTAAVIEYLSRPLEPLTLVFGLRRDRNSDFDDVTTGRATAAWSFFSTGTRLRGAWGTGQKAPTFVERFGYFTNQFIGNPDLEPEKSRGFELGIDQSLGGDRVSASVTYFHEDLVDEIDGAADCVFNPDTLEFICTAKNLAGESRRRGAEVALKVRASEAVDFGVAYTYLDATEPRDGGSERPEIRRPRHTLNLNANLSFAQRRGNLNANLLYNGRQTDTFFGTFPASTVNLDSYDLLGISGSYRLTSRVTAYARLENGLDENYENVFGYNTPDRRAFAGLRVGL